MADMRIDGSGYQLQLIASNTFPIPIILTQFATDQDPFDYPVVEMGDSLLGLNADSVSWAKPVVVTVTWNFLSGGTDEQLLDQLFRANMVLQGRPSARDVITAYGVYPDGTVKTHLFGVCSSFMPAVSTTTDARRKTRPYTFKFGQVT